MKPTGITPTLTAAMVFGLAQTVDAADGTYTSQAGAWNLTGSWSGGTIADGTDSTAFFTNDVTAARTTSLGADRTIGHIVFTDANNTTGYNRTIANNILTFDVTSGRSTIDVTQGGRQLIFDSQLSGDDGLKLNGPGQVRFNNSNNDYSGGTEINAGTLWLAASGTAGSGTIYLGNTTGSDNAELRMSVTGTTISNALEVRAGSSGVKTLANRSTNTVTYSGTITANDDLAILLAGATGGGVFTISGASKSIAASKMVSFEISGGGTGSIRDRALWSGDGSISYTSDSAKGFTVSGDKTYSGGATLDAMSGTGIVIVETSSTGPANAPTSGPFGTGTLTLGATKMQGWTTSDITIGNAITFSNNPTFTTVAAEKSLIFTGDASLGATRTLTVETGSTVAGTFVEFSGGISGAGFGISKEGAGTLRLSGDNSYTGATVVSVGTLMLNGNISTSLSLTVEAGATLGGDGTLGTATISGSLAPGNSIGTLTATGDVTWNANHAWVFELGMPTMDLAAASLGSDNDLLLIANGGDFLKGSGSAFTFDFANTGAVGWYKLVDWDGTTDFADTDFVATKLDTGLSGTFTVDSGTSALYLNVIPEPSAAVLLGLGGSLILFRRRVRS
ncbi:MAG: autotransporter-associated beta strand repeat-containing protein [Akkermansiaceae bacterium]|nr:autotransporter-associated beta strand repeat-containing protein [Akkermansiaceae bacterium]